ncbi:MAG: phosphoribosylanthranilate isomerase, partial [Flavobacteriales bacterium]|nr:phosphoribosylanthranilate isomerase [Flavobacteriales bacterium]
DEDDLLVFYFSEQEFINIRTNIESLNITTHHAKKPYWNKNGILIKDPDGFGVIISIQK